jgi:hypothetical protein
MGFVENPLADRHHLDLEGFDEPVGLMSSRVVNRAFLLVAI